jgi:hypothetical protein
MPSRASLLKILQRRTENQTVLDVDEAREIAKRWRAKFTDEATFETSWARYFETATVPDQHRLEQWLAKDLAKDEVVHAGIVKEPLLPTRSRYDLGDCDHCAGLGYVRVDVPISDPRFGKALACPDCGGGRRSEVVSPNELEAPARTGYWCWKCGIDQDQPAGERCPHPTWHIPNANGIVPTEGPRDHVGELTNHWRRSS